MRKKGTAIVLMVLMIAGGILLGGYRSLHTMEAQLNTVLAQGVDNDGFSILNDMESMKDASYNLLKVAQRYLPENAAELQALSAAREALGSATQLTELPKACDDLCDSVNAISLKLHTLDVTEDDDKYIRKFSAEILSRMDTIRNDDYNTLALNFNKVLHTFPNFITARLFGITDAPVF